MNSYTPDVPPRVIRLPRRGHFRHFTSRSTRVIFQFVDSSPISARVRLSSPVPLSRTPLPLARAAVACHPPRLPPPPPSFPSAAPPPSSTSATAILPVRHRRPHPPCPPPPCHRRHLPDGAVKEATREGGVAGVVDPCRRNDVCACLRGFAQRSPEASRVNCVGEDGRAPRRYSPTQRPPFFLGRAVVKCFFKLGRTLGEEPQAACFFLRSIGRDLEDANICNGLKNEAILGSNTYMWSLFHYDSKNHNVSVEPQWIAWSCRHAGDAAAAYIQSRSAGFRSTDYPNLTRLNH
ncbi:uncharacterized protein [Aegilops tauschii subsp. strangulata]|uniref:uncharacterized protein n=1 Tax=Aegilops tauschii subsp. strangulata TaxID=200361 RepID=UPI003CC85E47